MTLIEGFSPYKLLLITVLHLGLVKNMRGSGKCAIVEFFNWEVAQVVSVL